MLLIHSFYNNSINYSKYSQKSGPGPPFIHTTLTYHNKIITNKQKKVDPLRHLYILH